MSEHSDQKGEHETRTHVLYLVGLLLLGFVLFSAAAFAGLNLAAKRHLEEESGASTTAPSTPTPPAAASKSNGAN